jgi:hypothetical protein
MFRSSLIFRNYVEWRCFFDAVIGKFGLTTHITDAPTSAKRRDPD